VGRDPGGRKNCVHGCGYLLVEEDRPGLGVGDYVCKLLLAQSDIDRHDDGAQAHRGPVSREVSAAVGHGDGDTIAPLHLGLRAQIAGQRPYGGVGFRKTVRMAPVYAGWRVRQLPAGVFPECGDMR